MTKKKTIRNSNKPLTTNESNYYDLGGFFKKLTNNSEAMSTLGNVAGNIGNNIVSGGLSSGVGDNIGNIGGTIGSAISTINPLVGGIISAGSGILGGATNVLFGSRLNQDNINKIEKNNNAMNSLMVDNSSTDSIANQWLNQNFGTNFSQSDIGKDGLFSNKAKNKYKFLLKQQDIAQNRALTAFSNAIASSDINNDLNISANYAAFGGELGTNGADFNNGQTFIDNGKTHEENPFGGVPIGIDQEGNPNLVEEGEVIFNDYVFSNRLNADKKLLNSVNLPVTYNNHSFAKIAKKIGEESKERPNDPISKRGLLNSMTKLQMAQEFIKQKNQKNQKNNNENMQKSNTFAKGGYSDNTNSDSYNYFNNIFSSMYPTSTKTAEPTLMDVYPDIAQRASLFEPNYTNSILTPLIDNTSNNSVKDNKGDNGRKGIDYTKLRYAPVIGSAIGIAQNIFNKPDYSSSNAILEAANRVGNYSPIGYNPIGNYLQYKPLDRDYYINKLNAQAGATRRAIMSTTNPSRNAALLASDYNSQTQLGTLARQAEEYNLAQRQAIEQFNRGTNQANAEMALRADTANQSAQMQARQAQLIGIAQAMSLRDNIGNRRATSMSANMTNFFNSLGNIGREEYSKNMIASNPALYYTIDNEGNITYKNRDTKKSKGGYLTIKKGNK